MDSPDDKAKLTTKQLIRGDNNVPIGISYGNIAIYNLNVSSQEANELVRTGKAVAEHDTLENPYQGLLTYLESDGDRYFGRNQEITKLWNNFKDLYNKAGAIRLLPIYGPSGSGKSSLARAGLVPELGRHPLPGIDQARVASLVPGNRPLLALATVLARIVTKKTAPIEVAAEFERSLHKPSEQGSFDGLQRIAIAFPDIQQIPLIILVDQFEEIYSNEADTRNQGDRAQFIQDRDAFVQNLLYAASDSTKYVSVILTMRSDFLGNTAQHIELNQLFSTQGFFVSAMGKEALRQVITEPAKQVGRELNDEGTIQSLIRDTLGQEGALPLLSFALQRIWDEWNKGKLPAQTLKNIDGVGGALTQKAQETYARLNPQEQKAAERIFMELVQFQPGTGARYARRRATLKSLFNGSNDEQIKRILQKFSDRSLRLITLSAETVEVSHEALIDNWQQLKDWLDGKQELLQQRRKIQVAAEDWATHGKKSGYLFQGRLLSDAKQFMKSQINNGELALSSLATEFVQASLRKRRIGRFKIAAFGFTFPLIGTAILLHFQFVSMANSVLSRDDCKPNTGIKFMLKYLWHTGYADDLREVELCNEDLVGVRLPKATMIRSNLDRANLSNAYFHRSLLPESSFRGSIIDFSDFSHTFLIGSDFRCLGEKCTTLFKSNFQSANLQRAKLQNTLLEGTDFRRSNLVQANFQGAKHLQINMLQGAILCETILPNYINISGDRNCSSIE